MVVAEVSNDNADDAAADDVDWLFNDLIGLNPTSYCKFLLKTHSENCRDFSTQIAQDNVSSVRKTQVFQHSRICVS